MSDNPNHVINFISENDYNYFLDLTSSQFKIFGASNGFASSIDSYDYSLWNDEFIDYSKLVTGHAHVLLARKFFKNLETIYC